MSLRVCVRSWCIAVKGLNESRWSGVRVTTDDSVDPLTERETTFPGGGVLGLENIRLLITSAHEVMFSSLFVCLLATLRKSFQMDLREIFRE